MKPLIVLGITGSIAAVRAFDLCRELRRHKLDVQVVLSDAASQMATEQAMEFASGRKVITGISGRIEHVRFFGKKGKAKLLLIAPATANTISKIAMGIDDTPVTTFATVAIGAGRPVLLAPAMHEPMYEHPIVMENLQKLEARGVRVISPLMEDGKAKLAEIDRIVFEAEKALAKVRLGGKKVLVASGAFSVPLDDVRVLTNLSSGKFGNEIALACAREGANVKLIGNGYHDSAVDFEDAHDADELREKVFGELLKGYDYFFCPAAIPDFETVKAHGKLGSEKAVEVRLVPRKKMLSETTKKFPETRVIAFKAVWGQGKASLPGIAKKTFREGAYFAVAANDLRKNPPGSEKSEVFLRTKARSVWLEGTKAEISRKIVEILCK